jgi:hypothetical protein
MRLFVFWTIALLVILNMSFCTMSNSNELDDDESSQTDGDFSLDKKPSWAVGKRIIEFKRHSASNQGGGDLSRLFRFIGQNYHENAVKNPNRKMF